MSQDLSVRFLGAAGTVTGSKFLLNIHGRRLLVDCGLFQGAKALRRRNWNDLPVDASHVDAVVLTHAHLDHSGYLPRLVRRGFQGPVITTPGSIDLLKVLLPDAAHLEEEHAAYANKKGFTRHQPAVPLFTGKDAQAALKRLRGVPFGKTSPVGDLPVKVTFHPAGHILGAAIVQLAIDGGPTLVFSGDLGRYDYPIVRDPSPIEGCDVLFVESTYADRSHESHGQAADKLAEVVKETLGRGGVLLIPAFAVGRTQTLLYLLRQLEDAGRIPKARVFVDSPMATSVSRFYLRHQEEHDQEARERGARDVGKLYPNHMTFTASVQESKRLNGLKGGAIILSASGMLTGGRILHHAYHRLPHAENTLLISGYQAHGTRGRTIVDGERSVRMFGEWVPINAQIERIEGLSAHGDHEEMMRWMKAGFSKAPSKVFCVHGEPEGLAKHAERITGELGWPTVVPGYKEEHSLV